ncbi:hypothetical protein [Cytophaga sp. FL35]|uniref:hypothetical protein n=1 Tax=Cytophaga sp. FL35 TaxID=1904456 RepID=UPI001653AC62|nr:hypothetical protein [Cytophaga sp. FL35]MBC6999635.1 hypothetical protein [Cytophaga sp. FL35]
MMKVKAFTLSEIIISLLITTIVVGMAFAVLNLVQNQMLGIQGNYERQNDLNSLKQSLWVDFNSYESIWLDTHRQEIKLNNAMGQIQYELYQDYIVKEKDTFFVKLDGQNFFFRNRPVQLGKIDALKFISDKKSGNQTLFVYKQNSAYNFMQ